MTIRDIKADYRRAYLEAYEGLVARGMDEDADVVADILATHYGHDPRPKKTPAKATAAKGGAKENTAQTPAPENTSDTGTKE